MTASKGSMVTDYNVWTTDGHRYIYRLEGWSDEVVEFQAVSNFAKLVALEKQVLAVRVDKRELHCL